MRDYVKVFKKPKVDGQVEYVLISEEQAVDLLEELALIPNYSRRLTRDGIQMALQDGMHMETQHSIVFKLDPEKLAERLADIHGEKEN